MHSRTKPKTANPCQAWRKLLCAENAFVGKSSLKSVETYQSSINAIVRFARSKEAQPQIRRLLSPPRISGGLPAKSTSRPGLRKPGFGRTSVPNAVLRYRIRSGAPHISGSRPVCSTRMPGLRLSLIYSSAPRPLGTRSPRRESSTKPCPNYLCFLSFCTRTAMRNHPDNRTAGSRREAALLGSIRSFASPAAPRPAHWAT